MGRPNILFIIGCDGDPEPIKGDSHCPPDKLAEKISWNYIKNGVSLIREFQNEIRDGYGNPPRITWFLRSDQQMKDIYKDYAYPVKAFKPIWENCIDMGDEMGWHPHFWRWDVVHGLWYQEMEDHVWIETCLTKGFQSFSQFWRPKAVRTGNDFLNDFVMTTLNKLGLLTDLSVLPGMEYEGDLIEKGLTYRVNKMDYKICPKTPYFPSKKDYRIEDNYPLDILEIPICTFNIPRKILFLRFFYNILPFRGGKGVVRPKFKTDKMTYFAIAKHPNYFRQGLEAFFRESKEKANLNILAGYFHPHEIVSETRLFSAKNLKKNIELTLKLSEKYKTPLAFTTTTEATKYIMEERHGRTVDR
jgi:hypothetical protein